jgi:hypothetical protein
MIADPKTGFLIVLVDSGELSPLNPQYVGVDRLPPYNVPPYSTHFPEETETLEDYVFGDYKSPDSSLILDYSKALELWHRFSISRRAYEILLCCSGPDDFALKRIDPATASVVPLGYDVAGLDSACYSIIGDFTNRQWALPYLQALNENGLLQTRDEAEQYLREYRDHREGDWDAPFDVTWVSRVVPMEIK